MQVVTYHFEQEINLIFVGDLHFGDENSQYHAVMSYLKKLDANNYIVFMGDIIDNALKDSVANIYHQKLSPQEQLNVFIEDIKSIKHKVLLLVNGNHERRTEKQTGINLYALLNEFLDIPFFNTWGILDISIANQRNSFAGSRNRWNYSFAIHHGVVGGRYNEKSAKQNRLLEEVIENCDAYITAHTHAPLITYQARYVYDNKNKKISKKNILYATVGGFVEPLYANEKMLPPSSAMILHISLSGYQKELKPTLINLL